MHCAPEALRVNLVVILPRLADQAFALGSFLLALVLFLPTFTALRPAIAHFFLPSVELGLLLRRQNRTDLVVLLGHERLGKRAGLLHVAAERRGITLLTRRPCGIHQRLLLGAKRLELRLVLRADRLDLRLLGVGQVQIGIKITTASASAKFTAGAGAAAISATVGTGRSCC